MTIKDIKVGDSIELPPLYFDKEKYALGPVHHNAFVGRTGKVVAIEDVKVGRWNERVFTLDDGMRTMISWKKTAKLPIGVDYGIFITKTSNGWIAHPEFKRLAESKASGEGRAQVVAQIAEAWNGQIRYRQETTDQSGNISTTGLRSPQLGALHAVGAHWSIDRSAATVIMPTGTGKTETMLACMIAYMRGRVLVVVPTVTLREQLVEKFKNLGLLRQVGALDSDTPNPIVAEMTRRPKLSSELDYMDGCNVVVANVGNVAQGSAAGLGAEIAKHFDYLIVDEAHHLAADTWTRLKEHFEGSRILQFTATPFRRDRKPVDGKVIFNYPLSMAQVDGYFNIIKFHPVLEKSNVSTDRQIALDAVATLQQQVKEGFDHLAMARCSTISRAEAVLKEYEKISGNFRPVMITSKTSKKEKEKCIQALHNRTSRVLICVDMFGEGFDFPNFKIAALHDPHKSLAISLQFTGRFTRTASKVGPATVIADVSNASFMDSLDDLYSEDADWNKLLSEFSSEAIKSHIALIDFLRKCERIDTGQGDVDTPVSPSVLQPKFSMVAYKAEKFVPKNFYKAIPKSKLVKWAWVTQGSETLFFVTMHDPKVKWSRSRQVRNREWDFFVVHYHKELNLIYLHSSDTSSIHQELANEVAGGEASVIAGDDVFKTLGRVNRLTFQKVGLKRPGRRNISYSSFSGIDVELGLSESQKGTATKSDLSGSGFEAGVPVSLGCSRKGRVWSKKQGSIQEFTDWCRTAGEKLTDVGIDAGDYLRNTMRPTRVESLPDKVILRLDWPIEFIDKLETNVAITANDRGDISQYELKYLRRDASADEIEFGVVSGNQISVFKMRIGGPNGYSIVYVSGPKIQIEIGSNKRALEEYLYDFPPSILFVDGSELDGCLLFEPANRPSVQLPTDSIESWDWCGVNIRTESRWKDGVERKDSIQSRVIDTFVNKGFDIVFDDDGSGESADVVCIKETDAEIELVLLHCKFSTGDSPGERIKDVVEVCSQAIKSNKWIWRFDRLCDHLLRRDSKQLDSIGRSRFASGTRSEISRIKKNSRFKNVNASIVVVQPGIDGNRLSEDQSEVLSAAHSYLIETVSMPLRVICS